MPRFKVPQQVQHACLGRGQTIAYDSATEK